MSTHAPSQTWKNLILTGHFEEDDVFSIAQKLSDWLTARQCSVTVKSEIKGEECESTVTWTEAVDAEIDHEAITLFLNQQHAHPKWVFQEK